MRWTQLTFKSFIFVSLCYCSLLHANDVANRQSVSLSLGYLAVNLGEGNTVVGPSPFQHFDYTSDKSVHPMFDATIGYNFRWLQLQHWAFSSGVDAGISHPNTIHGKMSRKDQVLLGYQFNYQYTKLMVNTKAIYNINSMIQTSVNFGFGVLQNKMRAFGYKKNSNYEGFPALKNTVNNDFVYQAGVGVFYYPASQRRFGIGGEVSYLSGVNQTKLAFNDNTKQTAITLNKLVGIYSQIKLMYRF